MKIISITSLLFLLFFSCKKKEEVVDKCKNGFKDAGETNIDCGGNCDPCPIVYLPSVQCNFNNKNVSFPVKILQKNSGTYSLSFNNDSLAIQLNLGIYDTVATYDITPAGSMITKSNTSFNYTYSSITNGKISVSSHDVAAKRMSGFFSVNFFQPGSTDTVRITSGSYKDLLY